MLYLEKLTELVNIPVVFGEEPFVFQKETKAKAVKEIIQTVEQTAKQTAKLAVKRTIPVKLTIILLSIIIASVLVFLAVYFDFYLISDILIYNELHDLIFTNIIFPICDMELYWNSCNTLD